MKKKLVLYPLIALALAVLAHYLPAFPVSSPAVPDVSSLSTFLQESESQFTDIIAGSEKKITWAGKKNTKTEFSLIYLHGYSASRQESAPLTDLLAHKLQANAFHTRLNGHGRGNAAMGENNLRAWKKDALEAYEIAKRLGEKIIIVSVSTGGTLSTWLSAQENTNKIVAQLLISPNFDVPNQDAYLIDLPLGIGVKVAEFTAGKNHTWTAKNELQEKYWSTNHPIKSVRPMIQLLKEVKKIDKQSITTPALMVYSDKDTVISTTAIVENFEQWGSKIKQLTQYDASEDTHVLASQIVSPNSVQPVLGILLDFLYKNNLVPQPAIEQTATHSE